MSETFNPSFCTVEVANVTNVDGRTESLSALIYGFNIVHDVEYPDHYDYKRNDINEILNISKKLNCKLITTEKDYFRLKKFNLDELKYISSELKIIDEEKFIKLIT